MNIEKTRKELGVNSRNIHSLELRIASLDGNDPEWDVWMGKLIEAREYQKQLRKRRDRLLLMRKGTNKKPRR